MRNSNGKYLFTVEDWKTANVDGESLDSFFEKEKVYKQKLEINIAMYCKENRLS